MSTERKRISKRFDELCYLLESGAIEDFAHAIHSEPELIKRSDNLGDTLFSRIVHRRNIEAMKLLLQSGADINAPGCGSGTPAFNGQLEAVRILLEHGADPNEIDMMGETPESLAKDRGHTKVVSLLQSHM